jgi:hypothetical protein
MSRMPFGRRKFLAGLGASTLASPFVRSLPSFAADPAAKRYLILLFTPNGVVRHLFGADAGTAPGSFALRPWLAPLAPYQSKMAIVDGLANKAAGAGTHGPGMASLWTGAAAAGDSQFGNGVSIDQLIAGKLAAGTKYPSLEFRARSPQDYEGKDTMSRMIYSGAGAPMDPWDNASTAVGQLFLGVSTGGMATMPDPAAAAQLEIRKRLFSRVDGELGRLTPKMCSQDAMQLQALRDGFSQLNKQITGSGGGTAVAACSQPSVMGTKTLPQASRDMIELVAMSVACDLTRVVSLQYSAARSPAVFDWLGQTTDHHSISHTAPQPFQLGPNAPVTSDPEHPTAAQLSASAVPIQQMTDVNVWYAKEIAYLVQRLDQVGVLDQCIICWGNELDNGSNHDHYDQTFVLIGGGAGALKTNQLVQLGPIADPYKQLTDQPHVRAHNDLLVTLARAMGVNISTFGDAALNSGPITELLA